MVMGEAKLGQEAWGTHPWEPTPLGCRGGVGVELACGLEKDLLDLPRLSERCGRGGSQSNVLAHVILIITLKEGEGQGN